MARWTPKTIEGLAGEGFLRRKEMVPVGSQRRCLPDPCVQPLETPLVPYQILTRLSYHLLPRRIIKSSVSPLIFKRKSPWLERPARPGPRVSGYPQPRSQYSTGGQGGKGCWQPPGIRNPGWEAVMPGSRHTQYVALALGGGWGGGQAPSNDLRRDRLRPKNKLRRTRNSVKRQKGQETEACVAVG